MKKTVNNEMTAGASQVENKENEMTGASQVITKEKENMKEMNFQSSSVTGNGLSVEGTYKEVTGQECETSNQHQEGMNEYATKEMEGMQSDAAIHCAAESILRDFCVNGLLKVPADDIEDPKGERLYVCNMVWDSSYFELSEGDKAHIECIYKDKMALVSGPTDEDWYHRHELFIEMQDTFKQISKKYEDILMEEWERLKDDKEFVEAYCETKSVPDTSNDDETGRYANAFRDKVLSEEENQIAAMTGSRLKKDFSGMLTDGSIHRAAENVLRDIYETLLQIFNQHLDQADEENMVRNAAVDTHYFDWSERDKWIVERMCYKADPLFSKDKANREYIFSSLQDTFKEIDEKYDKILIEEWYRWKKEMQAD